MSLFTDGPVAATDDLASHDSAVLAVASTEGIDLSKKLLLAMDELALELANLLPGIARLEQVAVTPAIRMWHAFRTLELVYRDAYHNQLNDRYASKRDQFAALGKWALEKLADGGVGIINNPIPKAPVAELSHLPGEQIGNTYYVCISWTADKEQEGAVGEWGAISTPDNSVLSVRPGNHPPGVTGWNVFVGLSPESMSQQNSSPLQVGQSWVQQDMVSTSGRIPHSGQAADYLRSIVRILQRG